jgi:hypothetical protein
MNFEDLSPELQEKARACKSKEELSELAASVGVHLSDDELEAVAGGTCRTDCLWDGANCTNDTECITNTGCPTKVSDCPTLFSCKTLFSCIPKNCKGYSCSQQTEQ